MRMMHHLLLELFVSQDGLVDLDPLDSHLVELGNVVDVPCNEHVRHLVVPAVPDLAVPRLAHLQLATDRRDEALQVVEVGSEADCLNVEIFPRQPSSVDEV